MGRSVTSGFGDEGMCYARRQAVVVAGGEGMGEEVFWRYGGNGSLSSAAAESSCSFSSARVVCR